MCSILGLNISRIRWLLLFYDDRLDSYINSILVNFDQAKMRGRQSIINLMLSEALTKLVNVSDI